MNLDPQKIIGLMDFFSILLPGARLTWLLMDEVGPVVLGDRYAKLDGAHSLGRLPVRELSFRPLGLLARILAGRVLRLGAAPHAEHPDRAALAPCCVVMPTSIHTPPCAAQNSAGVRMG